MSIAIFSTWTTYGTWLPGDPRGWFQRGRGLQDPDPVRWLEAALRMTESACTLDRDQRQLVEQTVIDHCAIREWILHGVNCRSNHVHVVVTAPGRRIEEPREQFKAWCTRRLKARARAQPGPGTARANWWSERGWDEYLDDEDALAEVVAYVVERQGTR